MRTLDLPMPWRLPMPADAGGWWPVVGRRLDALRLRHFDRGDWEVYSCQRQASHVYFVGGPADRTTEWVGDHRWRPGPSAGAFPLGWIVEIPDTRDEFARPIYAPWPIVAYRYGGRLPTGFVVATCLDTD